MIAFSKHPTKGFTLIELTAVIVVIGVLAAVAAPKVVNLQSETIAAKLETLSGALKSANGLVYAKAVIAGQVSKAASEIEVEGKNIAITYGYITPTTENIINVLNADIKTLNSATSAFTSDYGIFKIDILVNIVANQAGADKSNVLGCALSYSVLGNTRKPYYNLNVSSCG